MKQSLVQNAFWLQRYINLLISQHFHRKNLKIGETSPSP